MIELVHPAADLLAPVLYRMFFYFMSLSMVLSSRKRALLCPLPKKGNLALIPPIRLTELTRKLFEIYLLERLSAERFRSREQGGFHNFRPV